MQRVFRNLHTIVVILSVGLGVGMGAGFVGPSPVFSEPASQGTPTTQCPENLVALEPEMKEALRYITSSSFRETMLASLRASIPDAIEQADGLAKQITFLKKEIVRQERERQHAERVARDQAKDPNNPLVPCRMNEESSYCYAMNQYLMSTAANLANEAFLEALQCYQREGKR